MKVPYYAKYINDSPDPLLGEDEILIELANKFLVKGETYEITSIDIMSWHTLVKLKGSRVWLSSLRFEESK